jgi:hypothetical protein
MSLSDSNISNFFSIHAVTSQFPFIMKMLLGFLILLFFGKFYSFLREFVTQSIVQRMCLCSVQSTKYKGLQLEYVLRQTNTVFAVCKANHMLFCWTLVWWTKSQGKWYLRKRKCGQWTVRTVGVFRLPMRARNFVVHAARLLGAYFCAYFWE